MKARRGPRGIRERGRSTKLNFKSIWISTNNNISGDAERKTHRKEAVKNRLPVAVHARLEVSDGACPTGGALQVFSIENASS
jgi:hypothetical protein